MRIVYVSEQTSVANLVTALPFSLSPFDLQCTTSEIAKSTPGCAGRPRISVARARQPAQKRTHEVGFP